ncbi:hypothetical protein [Bacillus nakamurai]|uniref:hypothetical protein n=1 Tax=Bacillus nakamurai TaxID=1793963 RepID=UPI0020C5240A|nr:hypothetical protein [Bacillus nakamurai]MCP6682295.1 hypothetical protein [Bacillus nakamurai]
MTNLNSINITMYLCNEKYILDLNDFLIIDGELIFDNYITRINKGFKGDYKKFKQKLYNCLKDFFEIRLAPNGRFSGFINVGEYSECWDLPILHKVNFNEYRVLALIKGRK